LKVRWLVAIGLAALAVAFLYFGVLAPTFSLFRPAPAGSPDAPAAPLVVESSKIVPTAPPDVPSDPPAAVPVENPPASSPSGPSRPPHHRTSKSMGKFARKQFVAAVDSLAARLVSCPDRYLQRGFGTSPLEDQANEQFTMLVLDVSMHEGMMEVLGVSQQSNGSLSGAFVDCAQKMLRGEVIPAASMRDAQRTQYAIFLGPAMAEPPGAADLK
jgi:hypothetical protein